MANFDFQQTAQDLQDFVSRTPAEIAELRALYEALTQTGVTPVAADDWPVSDPQQNVIYRVAGTSSYTDYMWNGTDFIPMATYDNVPTDIPAVGSTDVITAGGVANHGSAFDISEYNKNGETLATYANLAAALSETNVPESVRKGGMSVKFVQSSDNKYVQYRLMKNQWSTNVNDWENTSTDEVLNFVSEVDVNFSTARVDRRYININWEWNDYSACYIIPIYEGDLVKVVGNASYNVYMAFLTSDIGAKDETPQYAGASGLITILPNDVAEYVAPVGSKFLYINKNTSSSTDHTPASAKINVSSLHQESFRDYVDDILYHTEDVDLSKYLINNRSLLYGNESFQTVGTCYIIPCKKINKLLVKAADFVIRSSTIKTNNAYITFASSLSLSESDLSVGVVQNITVNSESSLFVDVPEEANYVIIERTFSSDSSATDHTPLYVKAVFLTTEILANGIADNTAVVNRELFNISNDFDISSYLVEGKFINNTTKDWDDGGGYASCYFIPVKEGDVFFVKSPLMNNYTPALYWAFLTNTDTTTVNFASGMFNIFVYTDAENFKQIIIPSGTNYLYFLRTGASQTDHTPVIMCPSASIPIDKETLLKATFNSSYNEEDTQIVREDFCSLIKDKETIETFMLFSDPHLTDYSRYEEMTEFVRDSYISTLQKYYNSLPLDYCICGGDWLNFSHTDAEACAWLGYCDAYMRKLFKGYIPVMGNHDCNPYQDGAGVQSGFVKSLKYKTVDNLMFRENGKGYYSYDAINTKFYVVNNGVSFIKGMTNTTPLGSSCDFLVANRWEQVDWFANKLLSDDSEHSVVISHIYSNAGNESQWFSNESQNNVWAKGIHSLSKNIKDICIAYNNRESITLNGITYNFGDCTGHVAFYLTGHTHFDYVDTSGDIPVVCITDLEGGYLTSPDGTIQYTLTPTFDNCLVDYDNGKLYMVRVGAAVSRIVNFEVKAVNVGATLSLSSELDNVTWQSRDTSIATVNSGVVSGVALGNVGIIATDNDGKQEYFLIKVESV